MKLSQNLWDNAVSSENPAEMEKMCVISYIVFFFLVILHFDI